ncbi:beta-propeller fold lactonase family protein [Kribbella ginsengisoli]|uniref:Beta-propeller fold lactonase family protein n=2 Tax=Kribbella ginsengisoli TaxID=363865 RepID=A0ABP6Z233_9ACTN
MRIHRSIGLVMAGLGLAATALVSPAFGDTSPVGIASAGIVADSTKPLPITAQDRLYTADQSSNTVTVIDPSTDKTLGTIALGSQRVGATLSPQYLGDVGVHGLAFSPVTRRLAVVSVTSNTVDIVDTTTNKVLSKTDVGRAAHEGSFTADGKEFWVADRGRDTVSVVDALNGGLKADVVVGAGPSKVVMSPDGRFAYVNHIALAEITVVDTASRRVVDHITGLGDVFSSDQAISPDGAELWAAHKRVGKVSVIDLRQRKVTHVLSTGPDTNHPQFADTPSGKFVYLTIGGLDQTLVFRRGDRPELLQRIANHGHAPHGVWPSGDGSRVYVGLEKSDKVDVIDTSTQRVVATISGGQEPQAVVYAPRAASPGPAMNLGRQGLGQQPRNVPTTLPDGRAGETLDPVHGRTLEATVRPVAGVDMIQLQARGLEAATTYQAYSVDQTGRRTALLTFSTDAAGNAPMVLAFSSFTGQRVSIESRGQASAAAMAATMALAGCCCC